MKKNTTLLLVILFTITIFNVKAQDNKKFRFVFMTDIHLNYKDQAVEGFQKAIDAAEGLKPDFIITGGDLIMDALNQQYSRADSLYNLYLNVTKRFKHPLYNCMGNHEIWAWDKNTKVDTTLNEYGKGMYSKRISPPYYSVDLKGWHFVFLSSIQRDYNGLYFGAIDDKQLEWIQNDLKKVDPKTPIAIITHIPFLTLQAQFFYGSLASNGKGDVVTNSKDVLKLFKKHNLKLVLQGHLHYYEKLEISGITFITGGSVCGSWWRGPYSGTEEGFVVIDVNNKKIKANYFDYGWEAK
ncbi:MAG: metallophosphoesterase family protein [Bacteroidales bacterium]